VSATTKRLGPGRYLIDGEFAPSVTTALNEGFPKPALVDWAARATAGYAVDHWSELTELPTSERLRTLEKSRWATTRAASVRGTDVHRYAEALSFGEEVDVPEPLRGHVDAYLSFVQDWKPRDVIVEAMVGNRSAWYAGQLDNVADLVDGQRWLLDWKTTAKGVFPENVLQLAAYRFAEFYVWNGEERPFPPDAVPIDACGIVWLRADGYDLIPVEAGEREFRTFRYAKALAGFRKRPRAELIGDALSAPTTEGVTT
jgi:hypothetical protein